jgi:hypothetical protein
MVDKWQAKGLANVFYQQGLKTMFCVKVKSVPTQRAPDWWESARFQAVSVA